MMTRGGMIRMAMMLQLARAFGESAGALPPSSDFDSPADTNRTREPGYYTHLSKAQRKGKTLEELRALREKMAGVAGDKAPSKGDREDEEVEPERPTDRHGSASPSVDPSK